MIGRARAAMAVLLSAVCAAGADASAAAGQEPGRDVPARLGDKPVFTPYTAKPELRNVAEVRRLLEEAYPSLLRDAGVEGTARYWVFIDTAGTVVKVLVHSTSGSGALDEAGMDVVTAMQFTPARNRDRVVHVWIVLPVTFSSGLGVRLGQEAEPAAPPRRETAKRLPGPPPQSSLDPRDPADRAQIVAKPTFTPYTEKPRLTNTSEVSRALRAAYPPLLRDAGIGGTAEVWLLVDERGELLNLELASSSGHEALDVAALEVAASMRFEPARNRGVPVLVWIRVPVTFASVRSAS